MKIDSNNSNNILNPAALNTKNDLDKKQAHNNDRIGLSNDFINNGYSSLKTRELNNAIGILQIANGILSEILDDNNISLDSVLHKLQNAKFASKPVFSSSQIIKDSSDNVLFDANRILDIIPSDNKDIYMFKKALRLERDFIVDSINNMKNTIEQDSDTSVFKKDFLTQNSSLFMKAHNTAGLASKIDALLA